MAPIQLLMNRRCPYENTAQLPNDFEDVARFHRSMASYQETPLHSLNALARTLRVKGIHVKDESQRFGLNAFKGLGVSYALHRILEADPRASYTFVSCTDGNHGKALAWQARDLGHQAVIFMPKGCEERRVQAIEQYHAQVIVTDMNYDDTVRHAAQYAKVHDAYLVQDTALPGYNRIPNDIVLGYSTMVREALEQMEENPTHVFLQAGVGSMAGGVVWYLQHRYPEMLPFIGIMEADTVACIYESVRQNHPVSIGGEPYTAMAGLNCGEANPATFPLLKALAEAFITCPDAITFKGMARAASPVGEDASFSSGESGAVGLGLIEELLTNPLYAEDKKLLKLNTDSVILLFNTEGVLENA